MSEFPEEPVLRKAYYAMGEVCDLTGLKPHVLRYWETQFEALRPTKNRAGNRVYRPREVELILLVKHLLYERKFTIEGARQKLRELRQEGGLAEERHEVAIPELVQAVKEELHRLRTLLTLPEDPLDGGPASGGGGGGGGGSMGERGPRGAPESGRGRDPGQGGSPASPSSGGTSLSSGGPPSSSPLSEGHTGSAGGPSEPWPQLDLDVEER